MANNNKGSKYPRLKHRCVLGLNFRISFDSPQVGHDQFGNKWFDISNPYPEDNRIIDICLDTYNTIMLIKKGVINGEKN